MRLASGQGRWSLRWNTCRFLVLIPIFLEIFSTPLFVHSKFQSSANSSSSLRTGRYDSQQQQQSQINSLSAAAAASSSSSSSSSSLSGSSSLVLTEWSRQVYDLDRRVPIPSDPRLCRNAQREILPRPSLSDPSGPCVEPPGYEVGPNPNWRQLGGKLLSVECLFESSRSIKRNVLSLPSQNASVYLVYAQFTPSVESEEARRVRIALTAYTLKGIRSQFDSGYCVLVTQLAPVLSNVDAVGQDWRLYQEGLHYAWHRLDKFEWVIVMNDRMVGPVSNFRTVLSQATMSGAGLYLTSNWGGCCMRGFLLGFHAKSVRSTSWRNYWQRISFPCGKLGPIFLGEAQLSVPPLSWGASCVTSTQYPLSKTDDLGTMLLTKSPFLYRTGVVNAFTNEENVTDTDTMLAFLSEYSIEPHVEACGAYTIFTK